MRRISTSYGASEWAAYVAAWPVAVGRIARLIRRLRVDVVHTNSLHSLYGWAAAAVTRRPHVWHGREIVVQSGAALKLERFLARHFADKVVCMSQAIADQLDPANVEVVRETVDHAAPGSGRLVPPRDAAALADALVEVTPRTTSTSERSRRRSLQPAPSMGRFAEIFRQVAAGVARPATGPR